MNDDKWQRTVAKRRRQRRIQNLFACFIVLLVLLILSIIGGYYYYQRTNSPEYALEELQTAFEHRDIDTIHKYVDLKTLLPPNYKILTNDIYGEGRGRTAPGTPSASSRQNCHRSRPPSARWKPDRKSVV